MPISETYRRQVALLVRILPLVAEEQVFALKGGTAINLFIRNMPRLSVDIDLTYLPVQPRPESPAAINAAMKRIAERIKKSIPGAALAEAKLEGKTITKLSARARLAEPPGIGVAAPNPPETCQTRRASKPAK